MTALILPKLGMCKDAREAIEKLDRLGARVIGSGFYSRVYRVELIDDARMSPRFDDFRYMANLKPWEMMQPVRYERIEKAVRIVKVASMSDPGGLMAAKAAMLTKDYDDLAPRYYGITEFGDGCWMGELEVLTENPAHHSHRHSVTTAHLIANNGESRAPNPTLCSTSVYVKTLFAMKAAHEAKGKSCNWDIHTQNVMMRGDQPVITDPLSAS